MKLVTCIIFTILSTQAFAEHRCEGFYELAADSSEDCLETINVQHKQIEYNFEALVIETPELSDKTELSFDEMLSEKVLASDLIASSNEGWDTRGGFWVNGGHFTLHDRSKGIRFERRSSCNRDKLKITTAYPRDYSIFYGVIPSQTCNYLKLK